MSDPTPETIRLMTPDQYTTRYRSRLRPVSPVEILREEYLVPLNLTYTQLADKLCVSVHTLRNLGEPDCRVTVELAFKLARYFGTTIDLWIEMQNTYEVRRFESHSTQMLDIMRIQPRAAEEG